MDSPKTGTVGWQRHKRNMLQTVQKLIKSYHHDNKHADIALISDELKQDGYNWT